MQLPQHTDIKIINTTSGPETLPWVHVGMYARMYSCVYAMHRLTLGRKRPEHMLLCKCTNIFIPYDTMCISDCVCKPCLNHAFTSSTNEYTYTRRVLLALPTCPQPQAQALCFAYEQVNSFFESLPIKLSTCCSLQSSLLIRPLKQACKSVTISLAQKWMRLQKLGASKVQTCQVKL